MIFLSKLHFQIVPTTVKYRNGTSVQTNQYSVTEHLRHVNPGSGRGREFMMLLNGAGL